MKNVGHVMVSLDMDRVKSRADPDVLLSGAMARWHAAKPSDWDRARIMSWMDEQVRSRFAYDYNAAFDPDDGTVVFKVTAEDEGRGGPWSLPSAGRGSLKHDDGGVDLDAIASQCEDSCVEYMKTSLSYSAAGLEQYDRQSQGRHGGGDIQAHGDIEDPGITDAGGVG